MGENEAESRLSSVANAIRLLQAFNEADEMGISALAARLGLAKSTVHRLASTLVETRMLEQNQETGRYRLGLAVFQLGALVRRRLDVSAEAKPSLMALREQTDESVQLAVPAEGGIIYVNFLESRNALRMTSRVGMVLPAHSTAEGKVLLAFGHATVPARRDALEETLKQVRAQGFARDDEETEPGLRGLAAPVMDETGWAVAAVGIAGPAQRLTEDRIKACLPYLLRAAQAISEKLGARAAPMPAG